ncbi:MAG TPA: GntG family PLP-dependent aldolase [Candidatus Polarisedimenticolia bacterium]|nr:GntG family PLP-dependent aldolase [Candidatus Polarisedimenticolia bacterium]
MTGSVIDLRSDTITRPTAAMRRAMAEAEVGDDVYREDPTVRLLEERAAERLGKQAALFVPSGTMGNQIAINLWTRPGQEVVLEDRSHILDYEMAQMAAFSGVLARPIPSQDGMPTAGQYRAAIRPPTAYVARTGLFALENPHNFAGGTIASQTEVEAIGTVAREHRLRVHLDGARLFNAAVALSTSAAELAGPCDSVMVCLSKGLGAPIGSILAGPADFIDEAWRVRKRLGGGMRQVGVIAAAGIIALEKQVDRLADDHALAQRLAQRIAAIPGLVADPARVHTNIVIFEAAPGGPGGAEIAGRWRQSGVLCLVAGERKVRAVTCYEVGPTEIDAAADRLRAAMGA